MEKSTQPQFNERIRDRTVNMSVDVHRMLMMKQVPAITRPIVNQIVRSSSSVAANYRATTRSRSDAEFLSKICIVVEDCDETQFWLEYLTRTGLLVSPETSALKSETEELVKLFTAIKKKRKDKLQK
jgi:four helix bundle protein